MKLKILFAALLPYLFFSAHSLAFENFKTYGSYEVYGDISANLRTLSQKNSSSWRNTQNRFTFGSSFDLSDYARLNAEFVKNNRYWGQNAESANDFSDGLLITQANALIHSVEEHIEIKAGRQYYGSEGNYLIYFGPKHFFDGLPVSSIDGVLLKYNSEYSGKYFSSHLIYSKITERSFSQDLDTSLWGFKTLIDFGHGFQPEFAVYNLRSGPVVFALEGKNLWALNAALNAAPGPFNVLLDAAFNLGHTDIFQNMPEYKYKGYAFTALLNLPLKTGDFTFVPYAGFDYGSGDSDGYLGQNYFQAINADYRAGFVFSDPAMSAYNGNNSLANLTVVKGGLDLTAGEYLKFSAAYYSYKFSNFLLERYKNNYSIGSEFNLKAEYHYSQSINMGLFYGRFFPGKAIKAEKEFTASADGVNFAEKLGSYITIVW